MVTILDYGAGNLTSVRLALQHIGVAAKFAADASEAEGADRIIFPGVGSAGSGMKGVCERKFDKLLLDAFRAEIPVLSICLGMQMLLDSSEEDGGVTALGIIPGAVRQFVFSDESVKVPHMGWNGVEHTGSHPLWNGIVSGTAFYFVHSYFANPLNADDIAGKTEYAGKEFASTLAKGSFFATQFHPERSGAAGMTLLKNFMEWDGKSCF